MKKKKNKNCFELNEEYITINPCRVELEWSKNDKSKKYKGDITFLFVVFPSGKVGYRIEIDGEELTTIYYNEKEKRFKTINW